MSLPTGTRDRIDALQARMIREFEAAGEDSTQFKDRGLMVAWLVDTAERTLARRAEIESAIEESEARVQQAEQAEEEAKARIRDVEEREQQLRVEELRVQRQEGLSGWILGLFAELDEQGLDRMHVLQLAQVMRDSGLEPERVAAVLRAENVGGLLGYAAQIRAALEAAQQEHSEALEQHAALRQSIGMLEAQHQAMGQAIESAQREIQQAQHRVNMATMRAQEIGIYVDWLRSMGVQRVEQLPLETASIIAGTVLLGAVGTHGDQMLRIPPGPTMLLGGQVLLSDLPYILAPREVYAEMQQAAQRRQSRAEMLAEGTPAAD